MLISMRLMNCIKLFILVITGIWSTPVLSEFKHTVYPMTDLELSLLPPFCQVWGKKDESGTDAWVAKLKITNIHHLCKGLNHLNHAVMELKQNKVQFDAEVGAGELSYVLDYEDNHGHKSYPLKAYILMNRAKLYGLSGEKEKALADFTAALKANPKYDKVYYELSEFYIKNNKKDKAKEAIEDGLRNIPESKLLSKINNK